MSESKTERSSIHALIACVTIVSGTVLLLSAIDLVLPSLPSMPNIFDTTIANAQLVIASFVAGSTLGMLAFGSLAEHYGRRRLFIGSLVFFTIFTFAATLSTNIWSLIGSRFLQGAAASGTAVLAPGLIRGLFSDLGAMRALSAMGSIEALVPGLAPLAGVWLHNKYGWTASFTVTGTLVTIILLLILMRPSLIPSVGAKKVTAKSSYISLFKNATYLRYGLGHSFVLGGLLCFVFTAPAIIIETMGGTISHFITMQMVGVTCFILSANISGNLVKRWSAETVITAGTVTAMLGGFILLVYSFFGSNNPGHLTYMFWVLNTGLGLRGGAGFVQALAASHGNDDRASAVILVSMSGLTAISTALIAPFISYGLTALTIVICCMLLPPVVLMLAIKPLEPESGE